MLIDIIPDPAEIRNAEEQGLVFSQDHKILLTCHNEEIKEITIPDGVTEIGSGAFRFSSKNLTKINLPDGLIKIGISAFYNCGMLSEIVIPNSVTTIDAWAFQECRSLESIKIPKNVTYLGYYAFHQCSSLSSIEFAGKIKTHKRLDFCQVYQSDKFSYSGRSH